MSIDLRRPAAGQWTAAYQRDDALRLGGRRKRLAPWLVILPTLAVFSLVLVAGAYALRKPDYESAIKSLPQNRPIVVVAGAHYSLTNPVGWFSGNSRREVCSVSEAQLATIAKHYQVRHETLQIDGQTVDVVLVDGPGANDHELREYLGDPNMKCKLVRQGGVFFLPFDPNTS
jgi:hypothetical protein